MWVPIHDEEWDDGFPLDRPKASMDDKPHVAEPLPNVEKGEIVFKGDALPMNPGIYELRYHHDGKYNVMAAVGAIEIYVDRPPTMDYDSIRQSLLRMVVLCLDSDPSLVPLSAHKTALLLDGSLPQSDDRDPDDFRFWSEKQAKRIAIGIQHAFDVEYAPEVVMADANVASLARKIALSRELLAK